MGEARRRLPGERPPEAETQQSLRGSKPPGRGNTEPPIGVEPMTYALQERCSTN